jgi:hypothetical protein
MATTAKRLFGPAQLGNATATKYTVPAGTKAKVRHIHFFNPSGAPVTVTMSIGGDAAATRLFDAFSIPAGQPYDWYPYLVMDAAEIIAAHASAAATIVMTVFGDELTLG